MAAIFWIGLLWTIFGKTMYNSWASWALWLSGLPVLVNHNQMLVHTYGISTRKSMCEPGQRKHKNKKKKHFPSSYAYTCATLPRFTHSFSCACTYASTVRVNQPPFIFYLPLFVFFCSFNERPREQSLLLYSNENHINKRDLTDNNHIHLSSNLVGLDLHSE